MFRTNRRTNRHTNRQTFRRTDQQIDRKPSCRDPRTHLKTDLISIRNEWKTSPFLISQLLYSTYYFLVADSNSIRRFFHPSVVGQSICLSINLFVSHCWSIDKLVCHLFLVACTRLYKSLCRSVRLSVGPSVGPSALTKTSRISTKRLF